MRLSLIAGALCLVLLAAVDAHGQAIPSAKPTSFDNRPPPDVKTVNNCPANITSTVSTSTLVTSTAPAISTSAAVVVAAASTTASLGAAAAKATTKGSGAEAALTAPLGLGVGLLCAGLVLGAVV